MSAAELLDIAQVALFVLLLGAGAAAAIVLLLMAYGFRPGESR